MRGAFKCVMSGKQCAILCPTTILAWQHYQTTLARIGSMPVTVELLSRFRTKKQQNEILRRLKTGEIDIIIGTHRLVQNDVEFHDLGLAIVDEEQRFGVAQKERFKQLLAGVDMLSMSATPIPRTLNMAMSGIRDMSVIEEAPQNRHPVQTYVIEEDPGLIADAIRRELRRGGQIYYIHNHIETIQSCAYKVASIVPEARIATAHGKMPEEMVSKTWESMVEGEIDILVCTTLIETGVDIANCNTLIIEDADRLGLSQLYQLRGRVGRSSRRAYAYFTFKKGKIISEIAAKRLSAIREFTRFGSGFRIALRDLEIRGVGSVLSGNQHGHIENIGYDMYLKLLTEETAPDKSAPAPPECLVDIQMDAHISENYISNLSQRIDVYKKIAAIKTVPDSREVIDELIDRFGEPPGACIGLIDIALYRTAAAELGFYEIIQNGSSLIFKTKKLVNDHLKKLIDTFKSRVLVNAGEKPYIAIRLNDQPPIDVIKQVVTLLKK